MNQDICFICSNVRCLENGESCNKHYQLKTCLKAEDIKFQKNWLYDKTNHNSETINKKMRGITEIAKE